MCMCVWLAPLVGAGGWRQGAGDRGAGARGKGQEGRRDNIQWEEITRKEIVEEKEKTREVTRGVKRGTEDLQPNLRGHRSTTHDRKKTECVRDSASGVSPPLMGSLRGNITLPSCAPHKLCSSGAEYSRFQCLCR